MDRLEHPSSNQYGAGRSSAKDSDESAPKSPAHYDRLAVEFRAQNRAIMDRSEEMYRGWPLILAYQKITSEWRSMITDFMCIHTHFLVANVELHDHSLSRLIKYIKELFRRSPPAHYKVQTRLGLCLVRMDNEQNVPYLLYHAAGQNTSLHEYYTISDNASLQRLLRRYSTVNLHERFTAIEQNIADSSNSRVFAVTNAEFYAFKVT